MPASVAASAFDPTTRQLLQVWMLAACAKPFTSLSFAPKRLCPSSAWLTPHLCAAAVLKRMPLPLPSMHPVDRAQVVAHARLKEQCLDTAFERTAFPPKP